MSLTAIRNKRRQWALPIESTHPRPGGQWSDAARQAVGFFANVEDGIASYESDQPPTLLRDGPIWSDDWDCSPTVWQWNWAILPIVENEYCEHRLREPHFSPEAHKSSPALRRGNLADSLRAHVGRWVAVRDQAVIFAADSPIDVVLYLRKNGLTADSTFRVPVAPDAERFDDL
ncbi:hypothetical protein [Micromonospora sp. NPDC003241]